MGKGDKRTKRGKINIGSFGKARAKASKSKTSHTAAGATGAKKHADKKAVIRKKK